MLLRTCDQMDPAILAAGWKLYCDAFDELRIAAVQRHVMTRPEFDAVMRDPRVIKLVVVDPARGDRMCGLATMSNHLDAVPLVSPDYFAHRWPHWFARRRIWYVGFVAVQPDYQGTGVFAAIVGEICRLVSAGGGIAAMDVCRRNQEFYMLPTEARRLVTTFAAGVQAHRLDEQTYWAYEFPGSI